jgi:hypothetical protein
LASVLVDLGVDVDSFLPVVVVVDDVSVVVDVVVLAAVAVVVVVVVEDVVLAVVVVDLVPEVDLDQPPSPNNSSFLFLEAPLDDDEDAPSRRGGQAELLWSTRFCW